MKKLILIILAMFCVNVASVNAQEFTKKELKKIEKDSKEEAKNSEDRGWQTMPGSPSMQMQFERAIKAKMERDEYGQGKYIVMPGTSTGETYNAAKVLAIQAAKSIIATNLEQVFEGEIVAHLGDDGVADASVETAKMRTRSAVEKKIGQVIVLSEVYKKHGPKSYEVSVQVAYDMQKAMDIAKESAREALMDMTK